MLKVVPTPEAAKEIEAAQEEICKAIIHDSNLMMRKITDRIAVLKMSDREKTKCAEVSSIIVCANVLGHLVAAARMSGASEMESGLYIAKLAGVACEKAMDLSECMENAGKSGV